MSRYTAKAEACTAAMLARGMTITRDAVLNVCAIAEHESACGDAPDLPGNWGAVQRRGCTAEEKAAIAAGKTPAPTDANEQLHGDSDPVRGHYAVWFWRFPTDVEAAKCLLRYLVEVFKVPRLDCGPYELAASMYHAGYYAGFHDARAPGGDEANIHDYAKGLERARNAFDAGWPAPTVPELSSARASYLEIASGFVGIDSGSQRGRYEDAIMPQPPEPDVAHRGYDEASGCALWQRAFIRLFCKLHGLQLPQRLAEPYRMSMAIVDLLEMGRAAGAYHVPASTAERAAPSDIVYIGGTDGTFEHVFCVTGPDECIEGGVIVRGHQGVLRDSIGWNVTGGVLRVGKRRVNGWIDFDKLAAWLGYTVGGHPRRPPNCEWADPPRMPPY